MKSIIAYVKKNFWICVAVLLTACFYLYLFITKAECPIKSFFGISCPGCGMSRACLSALRLDFEAAFYYHPLWIALPIFALLLLVFALKKNKSAIYTLLLISAALLIIVYIIRLFFGDGVVVAFTPTASKLYRFFDRLF